MTLENSTTPTDITEATQGQRLAAIEEVLSKGVLPQLTRLALAVKEGTLNEWADSVAEAWTEDASVDDVNPEEPTAETVPQGTYF